MAQRGKGMSQVKFAGLLAEIRNTAATGMREYNAELESTRDWMFNILDSIRSGSVHPDKVPLGLGARSLQSEPYVNSPSALTRSGYKEGRVNTASAVPLLPSVSETPRRSFSVSNLPMGSSAARKRIKAGDSSPEVADPNTNTPDDGTEGRPCKLSFPNPIRRTYQRPSKSIRSSAAGSNPTNSSSSLASTLSIKTDSNLISFSPEYNEGEMEDDTAEEFKVPEPAIPTKKVTSNRPRTRSRSIQRSSSLRGNATFTLIPEVDTSVTVRSSGRFANETFTVADSEISTHVSASFQDENRISHPTGKGSGSKEAVSGRTLRSRSGNSAQMLPPSTNMKTGVHDDRNNNTVPHLEEQPSTEDFTNLNSQSSQKWKNPPSGGSQRKIKEQPSGGSSRKAKETLSNGSNRKLIREPPKSGSNRKGKVALSSGSKSKVNDKIMSGRSDRKIDEAPTRSECTKIKLLPFAEGSDRNLQENEISKEAVHNAMQGPARVTRTKARAIMEKAVEDLRRNSQKEVEERQEEQKILKRKASLSGTGTRRSSKRDSSTNRAARKSIAKAVKVLTCKATANNPNKATRWCANTRKPLLGGDGHPRPRAVLQIEMQGNRVRCNSASEPRDLSSLGLWKKLGKPVGGSSSNLSHISANSFYTSSNIVKGAHTLVKKDPLPASSGTSLLNVLKSKGAHSVELDMKIQEATKKKEEALRRNAEEKAIKRQMKHQRVLSAKDEKERERAMMHILQERAREEKLRIFMAEKERLIREKKELHASRQQEAEARRKMQEEKRKEQQMECQPLNSTYDLNSYNMTLNPEERAPMPSKTPDDYGLDDVSSADSSDDEARPKKSVPKWANGFIRQQQLLNEIEISKKQVSTFFGTQMCTPNLSEMFNDNSHRFAFRRSSAVWDMKLLHHK